MATYENDVLMTRKTENGDLHIDYPVTNYGNVLNAPVIYNSFTQVNSNYTETTPLGEVFASMADHSVLTVEITTAQTQYENLTGVLTLKRVSENLGSGSLMADGNLYSLQITKNSNGGGV